jgi:Fe-S oxidoreductase
MNAGAVVMTVLLIAALGTFAVIMRPRMMLLARAKPDDRFDRWGARIGSALKFAVGQWRMPREPVAGFAHIFIFGGFLVVSIATITHFVHAYSPGWAFPGLGGPGGQVYSLVKDIVEFLVIIGCVYAVWRRLSPRPSRVGRSREGVFILLMIVLLMLTDFLIYGGELASTGESGLPWNPGGQMAAVVLAPLGADAAHAMGVASYWIHCIAVLLFLNFLPLGKHFHVITAIPKVFFRDLRPYGRIRKDDIENQESFGIRSTADLTWSQVLDVYSCTECGRCNVYCPTVLTEKPLSHRQLNQDLKGALYADKETILSGDGEKIEGLEPLIGGKIGPDTIWACTTCGSCEQECPVFIENVPRIIEMRKHQTLMEGKISPELAKAFKGLEQNFNPWGIGSSRRDEWAEGLEIPRMADLEGAEKETPPLLYWIGCAGSFDDRSKKITLAMVKILEAAGVRFAILGQEEACTGDAARRAGNEYLFQILAEQNVEVLNKYKVKKIVTHCPHCLHTLKQEYPQFGGNYDVIHHSQLIEDLLRSGKLKLRKGIEQTVAWHDSCYLGRYHDIYDAPRRALRAVGGTRVVELARNRSRSVCCGAGGARFWMEETIGEKIYVERSREALAAKADKVGSACPFCLTMMRDGVAHLGKEEEVGTLDLAEIVAEAL